jgi:DNA-directed RNA polymerase specialized sigma24 family protein
MSNSEGQNEQQLRAMRLVAIASLRDLKQRDKVDLLDRAGYGQTEIAQFLGSTPKTISTRLSEIRKARKRGTR